MEARDVEPERQMRRVTLVGSPESIQWAHYLIGQVKGRKNGGSQREREKESEATGEEFGRVCGCHENKGGVELVKCALGRM